MRSIIKGKKSLLLVTNSLLFRFAKSLLEKMGCEVTDEIDATDFDFVIVDDFFLQTGLASFIRPDKGDVPVLVIGKSRIVQKAKRVRQRPCLPLVALN